MMDLVVDLLSAFCLVTGGAAYAVGALGLHRMPDLFTRMHAVSVSDTLGVGLMILGMILQAGFTLIAAKLVIMVLIIWATGPVATHALARAALHASHRPLLVDAAGTLKPTDVVDLFPELGVRLATPYTSETGEPGGAAEELGKTASTAATELDGYGLDRGSETNPDARPPADDSEGDRS